MPSPSSFFHRPAAGLAALALTLAGCAGAPTNPSTSQRAPATSPAPAAAGAAATPPGTPLPPAAPPARPFAQIIKDAKRIDGPVPAWQKDDKVWLELPPQLVGKPLLLSPKLRSGIGEAGLLGGLMVYGSFRVGGPQVVQFRRVHDRVQLVATNNILRATPGTPEARAVADAVSPSLLGSTGVASLPHPESQAILIEANALLLADVLGLGQQLQRSYRQSYAFDARNSAIDTVRATPGAMVFETTNHFYAPTIATPQPGMAPGMPVPTAPSYLPDARSLFVKLHFSLAPLPEVPMAPRKADPRLGFFTSAQLDFSDDLARSPRVRHIIRWRLEKRDPAAELSEPVKPITYWIDRNVPLKYREAVTAGILEWNKAFERIGFSNAIVVRQQPDDADFDTLDVGVASVRWMTNPSATFGAIGPAHADPRSGEILDADIAIESLSSRSMRWLRSQVLTEPWPVAAEGDDSHASCRHGEFAAEQLSYALDVLAARGDIDPASPEAEAFVLDYLKDTTMHEVGHTLGLRHNFRASRTYTEVQLADPAFTREHGTAGSVMEYNAINLPRPGERPVTPFQTVLGPYDYWAIEYAYKPIAPEHQEAELLRIAARNTEPLLAYGTDEDNALGVDPETLQFDLGADPIAFARKRLDIARELFRRQETRRLKPDEDWSVLRRSLSHAIRDAGRAAAVLARQIGGVRTLRDFAGSGRDPLQPVEPALQRESIALIADGLLSADSLRVSPALQRRLAPDFLDRSEFGVATDYPVAQQLLDQQRNVLNALMSDAVAARLLDSEGKALKPGDAFRLSELYMRLTRTVWGELRTGTDIVAARRELQREHLNRVANALLRPSTLTRADARSLLRSQARQLLADIQRAQRRGGLSAEARAHLQDSADSLRQALAAPLVRGGV